MNSNNWLVRCGLVGVTLAGVLTFAQAAQAAELTVEGFGGYYDPEDLDENGEIFGGRLGYNPSEHFGMVLSVGVIDLEDDFLNIEDADLRFQLLLADYSFQWYLGGSGFYLMAGPGYAVIDIEIDVPGNDNDFKDDNSSFTLHGGLGYRWDLGDSFFIRPELKARWFEGSDFEADQSASWEGLDTEYSLALGFRFGGH